jgi:hypothetical protein
MPILVRVRYDGTMGTSEEQMSDEPRAPRRRRGRYILLAIGLLLIVTLAVVWIQRKPIASDFIAGELERRGVSGRYQVKQIGFRTQRIENVSIGDPARPDLTAEWAEVMVRIGLSGPEVTGVRAGGVRLRARLANGQVSFGAVDKLLPPPSGKPFALPDLEVDLRDARMRLDTPSGPVGLKLEGRGNLTDGFNGKLAAVAPTMRVAGCPITGLTAWLDLSVTARAPHVKGPVRARQFACGGMELAAPQLDVDASLSAALDRWHGETKLALPQIAAANGRLDGVTGRLSFDGSSARTRGTLDVAANGFTLPGASGRGLTMNGAWRTGTNARGLEAAVGGKAAAQGVALDRRTLAALPPGLGAGTPIGPIAQAIIAAARRAGADMAVSADFTGAQLGQAGSFQLNAIRASSGTGARLAMDGALRLAWPGGMPQFNGRFSLAGGGFPTVSADLAQPVPGAPIRGTATMAAYSAGGARLALAPLRFTADPRGGSRFDTTVIMDGPLADGRVTGLSMPIAGRIDARGALTLNPGCAPLRFASLSVAGLSLSPTRLTLCPTDGPALLAISPGGGVRGGASIAAPRLAGRLGGTPIGIAAASARISLAGGIAADRLAVRLGAADRMTLLDIAKLDGRFESGGIAGDFAGLGGQIANVPLIVSDAAGRWSFIRGALRLGGGLNVADAASEPRFNQLTSNDFKLTLIDGDIRAAGMLREPTSGKAVTHADIAHDLGTGAGQAVLEVADLRFDKALQPGTLTRLAVGVVANVEGVVNGRGLIRWSPAGVTSEGVFRTTGANLAAAFGPVTNLSGEIRFTDLLGLETAPGQVLTIGEVNPGLPVTDGVLRYHLLPGSRVAIEGGEWPFAAGTLVLEPTLLDLGAQTARNLTFRVAGLNAGAFLQRFEFENINASGVFDGTLPIVFDENGGRIVDGRLVAREGGGSLAYVGELSQRDLGSWGNVAFQALRSIRYRSLELILNGDLDGEMITQIRFAGLSQGEGAKQNFLTRKIAALPIRFNVTIKAPFRQLLFSARSLYDPSLLIEQNLPSLLDAQRAATQPAPPPVQPAESENRR